MSNIIHVYPSPLKKYPLCCLLSRGLSQTQARDQIQNDPSRGCSGRGNRGLARDMGPPRGQDSAHTDHFSGFWM